MQKITENILETACMGWLAEMGYQTHFGPDVLPDSANPLRASTKEVVLKNILLSSVTRINPGVDGKIIKEALDILLNPTEVNLISRNREIYFKMAEGVRVLHKDAEGRDTATIVKIFDYAAPKNNTFIAINQFTIEGKQNRRPDIVLFINGLPVALFELKNPADEKADITRAVNQIQTYKNDIEELFDYNIACVLADGANTLIGAFTANKERYMPWRTITGVKNDGIGKDPCEVLIKGVFSPQIILDFMHYFTIFEQDKEKVVKKIAGYHQYHAVNKAVDCVLKAVKRRDGKGGVVWHTQGSGKSISMVCFANKIMKHPQMENPTIVVVTDRNDLDGQLYTTFNNSGKSLSPVQANSREELQQILKNKPSGGIVFATVQKFMPEKGQNVFPTLSTRENILVISDEAHRSQYGFEAKMDKGGNIKYGYAKYLRDALPNACFVGFTGTPIETDDKDTRAVFGDYIDIYDIQDAITDKATVPIYYEARQIPIKTKDGAMLSIDDQIEEVTEGMSEQEKAKTRWATVEELVDTDVRMNTLAGDIVKHFLNRLNSADGKGMIVCMSRRIAVHLYTAITAIKPEWHDTDHKKGFIKVMMTGSAADPQEFQQHLYTSIQKEELQARMKDPEDPLKLVIVCDMWLTGFDVPALHTMYTDKPMRGHNLMQAIARVNRVFGDKKAGLVVDYIGIARDLEKAVKNYTANGGHGDVMVDTSRAFEEFLANMETCKDHLHGFDYSHFKKEAFKLLPNAVDFILGKKDGKQGFSDACLNAAKAYSLCKNMPGADKYNDELAFFQYIRSVLIKKIGDAPERKASDKEVQDTIKAIVSNAIITDGVVDIFKSVGLNKPNISIISDAFLERVKGLPQKNLAAELLQQLINGEIKTKFKNNLIMQKKFSEELKNVVARYNNGTIETAQVIEELITIAKSTNEAIKQGEKLGLSEKEKAFYDALVQNESAVRELGDDILKKIVHEITDYLRKSTKTDWAQRDNIRAQIMIQIKRILKKYNYPPDKQETAVAYVLEQAEISEE